MWKVAACYVVLVWVVGLCSGQNLDAGAIFTGKGFGESDVPTTAAPPPTEYIVYDKSSSLQMPCVMVKMNMKLVIEPRRTGNKKITIPAPKSAVVTGSCGHGEDATMILNWGTFKFMWHFQKLRVSDAWAIDNIQLSYNTSDKAFGNATQDCAGEFQQIHSADPLTLYLTPTGRYFSCMNAKDVKLYDDKKVSRVTLKLNQLQIQPFAEMTHRQYGQEFRCAEEAGREDDTVPLLVGSLLALSALGTVGGYGGYRYLKVKKIEYDTIE